MMSTISKIDSSSWTGAPHGKAVTGLQGPSLHLVLGILIAFLLYSLLWHSLWELTGSPIVRTQTGWLAVLAALVGGALMFLCTRNRKKRWFWAAGGLAATSFLSSLTFYVTDFLFADEQAVSTHFVEGRSRPGFYRRHTQLRHEARLSWGNGRRSDLILTKKVYDRITAGDSCITLIERRGTLHIFAKNVEVRSSGDGTGHWMQIDQNRRRCLAGRVSSPK
jgi:hypothetical protein